MIGSHRSRLSAHAPARPSSSSPLFYEDVPIIALQNRFVNSFFEFFQIFCWGRNFLKEVSPPYPLFKNFHCTIDIYPHFKIHNAFPALVLYAVKAVYAIQIFLRSSFRAQTERSLPLAARDPRPYPLTKVSDTEIGGPDIHVVKVLERGAGELLSRSSPAKRLILSQSQFSQLW